MNHWRMNRFWLRYGRLLSMLFILTGAGSSMDAWAGDLSGSGQHSLATSTGQPFGYAWGANQAGQLGAAGVGDRQGYPFLWSLPETGTAWVQVASGDWHSVALAADGTVWTWGQNGLGQLGDGTTVNRPTPMPVAGLTEVIAVAAGKYHSLAVTGEGRVWAWGSNDYRQLGNNGSQGAHAWRPVAVVIAEPRSDGGLNFPPLTDVIAVAASEVHSVALKKNGTVWAWGDNRSGQLGTCYTFTSAFAQPVLATCGTEPVPLTEVRQISAGGYFRPGLSTEQRGVAYTLAVREDGTIWGWGNNEHCQLGESAWQHPTTPQSLPNLNNLGTVRVLAGGDQHGAALTADGRVWTWGDNRYGQLGVGAGPAQCVPVAVTQVADATTLGAGPAHTLATRPDGTVWTWGRNHQGQLGDGTTADRPTPEPVVGVCGVDQLHLQSAPPAGCRVTVATSGVGQGTVAGDGDYAAGATVTLTATPADGSVLAGWNPPCAAQFTMSDPARALTCTARFTSTINYLLTVTVDGTGTGVVAGAGAYAAGEPVVLTAKPNPRNQFTGWSPETCAGPLLMPEQPLTCTATFDDNPIVPLTVVKDGAGQGTVSGGGQYQAGEVVTLTATPGSDRDHFAGWTPEPCAAVFTIPDQPLTCTATFIAGATAPVVSEHIWNYYEKIIGRTPTAAEQTTWENDLERMKTLGIDVAEGFRVLITQLFTSAEYQARDRSDTQYVADLYLFLLEQGLNADEQAHWLAALADGLPRDLVLSEVLFSAEFTAYLESQFGVATSRPEALTVMDFYRGLLNRIPDNEGFRYWLERFQTAQCQGAAAVMAEVEAISSQFANSPEYLGWQRLNREYLQDLYSTFLRRGGDGEGFNYWLNRLETAELTREQTRQMFVAAPEFQERVSRIIEQGCSRMPFTQVSAGPFYTCGMKSNGLVKCWGRDNDGQLTPPPGMFAQISVGGDYLGFGSHACGVRSDGSIECWADTNYYDQATPPSGTFTQVSSGYFHTCGVKTNGTVACWGENDDGQASPPDAAVAFIQVSAGYNHTCGLKIDGSVVCWGSNDYDQAMSPAEIFTQISAGGNHTCGVRSNGTVKCWGDNVYGQATWPAGVFTQVSAGYFHTCGLKNDGQVECWGNNSYGQVAPPSQSGLFTQISVGLYHTCGISIDWTVSCWGQNDYGQAMPPEGIYHALLEIALTGSGTISSQPGGIECGLDCSEVYPSNTVVTLTAVPTAGWQFGYWTGACSGTASTCQVSMNAQQRVGATFLNSQEIPYKAVSAAWTHTCGLKDNGVVICWGANIFGQGVPPAGLFTQISAAWMHTCGVKTNGVVACWGSNGNSQAAPPDGLFTAVSASDSYTCGVRTNGTVVCWGNNDYGQTASPNETFTQVSTGDYHACGVKTDGTLACWGSNDDGETTAPDGTFTQVSAGGDHTCGLKTDGMVNCWGSNYSGQAAPPAGVTFAHISTGRSHTCGVKTDGTVACWGSNDEGQADRPVGTFTQVDAGTFHTCGVKTVGTVMCWGSDNYGESTPPSLPTGGNLTPYKLRDWSDKIVVSNITGTTTDRSPLNSIDTLYVDFAIANDSDVATGAFAVALYVDGVFRERWNCDGLPADYYCYVEDYSIATLSAGQHTIKIVADSNNTVIESNEDDNVYEKIIMVEEATADVRSNPPVGNGNPNAGGQTVQYGCARDHCNDPPTAER